MYPGARISGNALDFLRAFERSGSSEVLEIIVAMGRMIVPIDGGSSHETFQHTDWRFFEDDISTLLELGLLRLRYDDRSQRVFIFTRNASNLVQLLDGRQVPEGGASS